MDSGTSQVLLNGVPGKVSAAKEELDKVTHCPHCFLSLLCTFCNPSLTRKKHWHAQAPLPIGEDFNFPIIQYADDTILIMEAWQKQLFFLKAILNTYAKSIGLIVNYHKSNVYPLNVSDDKMNLLANAFQCQIGCFPFTYLGLSMGHTKPKLEVFLPLIQKVERRLAATSIFVSHDGRVQMVNADLTVLPTYCMCTLMLPAFVIKHIDKLRRQCLWWGPDDTSRKPLLAAWALDCKPKS